MCRRLDSAEAEQDVRGGVQLNGIEVDLHKRNDELASALESSEKKRKFLEGQLEKLRKGTESQKLTNAGTESQERQRRPSRSTTGGGPSVPNTSGSRRPSRCEDKP